MSLSANEFARMKKLFWDKEIEPELRVWIEQLHLILEDPDPESPVDTRNLYQAQGSIRAIRNMLNLPENILEEKEQEEKQNAEREGRNESE